MLRLLLASFLALAPTPSRAGRALLGGLPPGPLTTLPAWLRSPEGAPLLLERPELAAFAELDLAKAEDVELLRAFARSVTVSKLTGLQPKAAARFVADEVARLRAAGLRRPVAGAAPLVAELPPHLRRLLRFEQGLNDRIEDTNIFASIKRSNTLDRRYAPSNAPVFPVETALLPLEDVELYGRLPEDLFVSKRGRTLVRFFVHPVSTEHFHKVREGRRIRKDLLATPTASARSLLLWKPGGEPFGVKLTLDAVMGMSRRDVSRGEIQKVARVSRLLGRIPRAQLESRGIRLLEETGGVVYRVTGTGYTTRTYPDLPEGVDLVPFFSLASKPPRGPPMLVRLAESAGDPKAFVADLVERIVDQSAFLALGHGLVGEPHQQNILLELRRGVPTGQIWWRDYGSFSVAPALARGRPAERARRAVKGLPEKVFDRWSVDFVEQMRDYVRGDVMFTFEKAFEGTDAGITRAWLDRTFKAALRSALQGWTGVRARTYREMSRAALGPRRRG